MTCHFIDSLSPFTGTISSGRTPYFLCLARPHGQPPNVIANSTFWRAFAIRWPFLARVQIGQRVSQNSGLNMGIGWMGIELSLLNAGAKTSLTGQG